MKKPTSKSASGTRKVSLPSGTSGKTDATEGNPQFEPTGKFAEFFAEALKRTPEESRLLMIRAGIHNEDGTLTPHYQPRPKAKKKPTKG